MKHIISLFHLVAFIVLIFVFAGCASVKVTDVPAPEGKHGYLLSCSSSEKCYEKAQEICGASGYKIENSTAETHGLFRGREKYNILVTCK